MPERGKRTKRAKKAGSNASGARPARRVRVTAAQARRLPDRTDFARLDGMTEEDIERQIREDPDAAEFTEEMLRDATWVPAEKKTPISLRVDRDVLEFFKREGHGYQSRMNAVLRSYVEHRRRRSRAIP